MKAIIYRTYGPSDVVNLEDVDKPVPADDQVLVKIHAAGVNPLDWHFMRGTPYLLRLQAGITKPKCTGLGVDVAGTVEAVGKDVTEFKPGDDVFGESRGAFAEYLCASEDSVVMKPATVTHEQAAAAPVAGYTALQALRDKGKIQPGQKVLIIGASGGVGTFAVQIAKSYGTEVTGVCSTKNVETVKSIGADHVIDYTKEEFTKSGEKYDLIVDTVGGRPMASYRLVMNAEAVYVSVGADMGDWIGPLTHLARVALGSLFRSQTMVPMLAMPTKDDLIALSGLLESGAVTPVIGRRYLLSEVPAAIAHQEEGHARGKTVISP